MHSVLIWIMKYTKQIIIGNCDKRQENMSGEEGGKSQHKLYIYDKWHGNLVSCIEGRRSAKLCGCGWPTGLKRYILEIMYSGMKLWKEARKVIGQTIYVFIARGIAMSEIALKGRYPVKE